MESVEREITQVRSLLPTLQSYHAEVVSLRDTVIEKQDNCSGGSWLHLDDAQADLETVIEILQLFIKAGPEM